MRRVRTSGFEFVDIKKMYQYSNFAESNSCAFQKFYRVLMPKFNVKINVFVQTDKSGTQRAN